MLRESTVKVNIFARRNFHDFKGLALCKNLMHQHHLYGKFGNSIAKDYFREFLFFCVFVFTHEKFYFYSTWIFIPLFRRIFARMDSPILAEFLTLLVCNSEEFLSVAIISDIVWINCVKVCNLINITLSFKDRLCQLYFHSQ